MKKNTIHYQINKSVININLEEIKNLPLEERKETSQRVWTHLNQLYKLPTKKHFKTLLNYFEINDWFSLPETMKYDFINLLQFINKSYMKHNIQANAHTVALSQDYIISVLGTKWRSKTKPRYSHLNKWFNKMFIKTYTGNSFTNHCDGYRFTTEFNKINKSIKYSWFSFNDVKKHFNDWSFKHQEKIKAFQKKIAECKEFINKDFLEEKNYIYTAKPEIPFVNLVNALYYIDTHYKNNIKREYYEDTILDIYYSNEINYSSQKWSRGTAISNNLPKDIRNCFLNNYIEYDLNSIAINSIYALAEIISRAKIKFEFDKFRNGKKIKFKHIEAYIKYKDQIREKIDLELGYPGITKLAVNNITMGCSFNRYSKFFIQYIESSETKIDKKDLITKTLNHDFFINLKKEMTRALDLIADFLDFKNTGLKKSEYSTFIYQRLESHIMFNFAKYLSSKNLSHLVLHDGIYIKGYHKYHDVQSFIDFELKHLVSQYFIDLFKSYNKFQNQKSDYTEKLRKLDSSEIEYEFHNNRKRYLKHIDVSKQIIESVINKNIITFSNAKVSFKFRSWNQGSFNKIINVIKNFKRTLSLKENLRFSNPYYILYINSIKLFNIERELLVKKKPKYIIYDTDPPALAYYFGI